MDKKWFSRFISWAQYLYWSELNRERFDQFTEHSDISDRSDRWKWWAFMSQFYASLWVVIEGWKTLKVKDQEIDYLISEYPQYCQLLKKFRHGVYHCRPTFIDARSLEFVKQGDAAIFWACALHEEFQRFYWEWPEKVMLSDEQIAEVRKDLLHMIGWLPTDIMPVRKHDLKTICDKVEKKLEEAGDFTSPIALELLDVIKQNREIVRNFPDRIFLPEFEGLKEKKR